MYIRRIICSNMYMNRIYIYIHISTYTHIYICIHVELCVHIDVNIHIYTSNHIFIYVYKYISIYIHRYPHIHTFIYIHVKLAVACVHCRLLMRGGGLGSRPKKMYGERLGHGVEYHLMSPTPRC